MNNDKVTRLKVKKHKNCTKKPHENYVEIWDYGDAIASYIKAGNLHALQNIQNDWN